MDYVQFSLKGPKYNKTNSFFVDILEEFLYCQKSWAFVFLTLSICRKIRISVITSNQWNMSLACIFWVTWIKVMQNYEVPDFWGLHQNMNCAFPRKQGVTMFLAAWKPGLQWKNGHWHLNHNLKTLLLFKVLSTWWPSGEAQRASLSLLE